MKKTPSVNMKKEEARCRKAIQRNWRGFVKLKYLVDLYVFAPTQEWHPVQPEDNEVFHAKREGRPDLRMWWNADVGQIEMNSMGRNLWFLFCHFHNLPF
jgi:hypothetical protein